MQFYKAALAVARAVWARGEAKTVRRAGMNGIVLMFWSDQPIPWDFLNSFFEHIIDRTHGGLVGGFEVACVEAITGAVINVALSIPGGTAAPAARRKNTR